MATLSRRSGCRRGSAVRVLVRTWRRAAPERCAAARLTGLRPAVSVDADPDRPDRAPAGAPRGSFPLAHRRFRPRAGCTAHTRFFGMTDIEGARRPGSRAATPCRRRRRVVSAAPPTLIAVDSGPRGPACSRCPSTASKRATTSRLEVVDQGSGRKSERTSASPWRGRRNRAGGEARGHHASVAPTERGSRPRRLEQHVASSFDAPNSGYEAGTARDATPHVSASPPSSGATTRAGRSRRSAMPLTRPPRTSAATEPRCRPVTDGPADPRLSEPCSPRPSRSRLNSASWPGPNAVAVRGVPTGARRPWRSWFKASRICATVQLVCSSR